MSAKEAMRRATSAAEIIDENTPFRTKIGVLVALILGGITATHYFDGYTNKVDATANSLVIVVDKLDKQDGKIDRLSGAVDTLGNDLRAAVRSDKRAVYSMPPAPEGGNTVMQGP